MDIDKAIWKFKKTIIGRLIMMPINHTARIYRKYRILIGEKLGLPVPDTFTMKLEWIKYFDRNPKMVVCADKVLAKDYVRERVGDEFLIKTLGVYDSASEVDFDTFPNKFVIKTNNYTGCNIICKDKSKLDIAQTRQTLDKWLGIKAVGTIDDEWQYAEIPPKILAEEYVEDKQGQLLDYKFFCFNGVPKIVWVDMDRYGKNKSRSIRDINWNKIPMTLFTPDFKGEISKPENYDKMVEIAAKLSEGFKLVRVDLYNADGKIYFGEMTFFSGDLFFKPRKYNKIWGEMLDLKK